MSVKLLDGENILLRLDEARKQLMSGDVKINYVKRLLYFISLNALIYRSDIITISFVLFFFTDIFSVVLRWYNDNTACSADN